MFKLQERDNVNIKDWVTDEHFIIEDVLENDDGIIKYLINSKLYLASELTFIRRPAPCVLADSKKPPFVATTSDGKKHNYDLTIPESTGANRYNSGKPELSYVLDFPKAFPSLMGATSCHYDQIIDILMDDNEDIQCIIVGLFAKLEYELSDYKTRERMEIPRPLVESIGQFITRYPLAIDEFVRVCANGALKYDRNNWKKGFPPYTLMDSALRHYRKYLNGDEFDVVDEKTLARRDLIDHFNGDVQAFEEQFATHHLAHVIWNFMVHIENGSYLNN